MDRVGAYNQRSSAYNMCGANEDDVVEPQRTRRSRRPREYDEVQYEDDDSQSTAPSRGDRGSFDDAPPRRPRRRQREEWPAQDELAPPPTHERRAVKAIAYTRQDEKSPGPAATPSSKGSTFGKLFTPKKPKESFRTKTLTELTETGTSSVARVKEGNVKFPNSWSGHKVTVFNPYHPRRLMWDATMRVSGVPGPFFGDRTRLHLTRPGVVSLSNLSAFRSTNWLMSTQAHPDHYYCGGDAL